MITCLTDAIFLRVLSSGKSDRRPCQLVDGLAVPLTYGTYTLITSRWHDDGGLNARLLKAELFG